LASTKKLSCGAGAGVSIQVRFSEISPYGNCYELQDAEGLASQQDFLLQGNLTALCTLKRKGDAEVEMQGHLKANLSLTCDRCLVPYDFDVDTKLQVLFKTVSSEFKHLKELECDVEDLDTVILDEPVIDLNDVLRQQLYLALPLKSLCLEQCRGICARCGENLNFAECRCNHERQDLPFAVLAQLKNKNIIKK
jgi:uncharacterized protein